MKVKDLIKELEKLPQDSTVGICHYNDEYDYNEFEHIINIALSDNLDDFNKSKKDLEKTDICDYYIY